VDGIMTRGWRGGERGTQAAAPALNAAFITAVLLAFLAVGPSALAATRGVAHPADVSAVTSTSGGQHPRSVTYYIVPPPRNGHKTFLFQIAAQTLGNGNLYTEIFRLNKGRLQPDGGRLENPASIDPGWILILPSGAHGPGVHFGPLPPTASAGKPGASRTAARPGTAEAGKPGASGTPARPGTAERWISRGLAGCLILLGMMAVLFAVRALLEVGTRPGRHRYKGVHTLPAAPIGRTIPIGGLRGGVTTAAPPIDVGAEPPARAPRARNTKGRPPSVPSLEACCPLPIPAPAVAQQESLSAEQEPPAPQVEPPAPQVEPAASQVEPAASQEEPAASQEEPAASQEEPPASQVEPPPSQPVAATAAPPNGPVTADPPNEPGGNGWPPVPGARRERATTVTGVTKGTVFPSATMRLLGVRTPSEGEGDPGAAVLRHEVALGDFRVKAVLAKAPASKREGRSPDVQTWVASTPYLVWTPLPHDVPAGGLAFVCLGAADSGCLFIDLAAAPGAVALRGEPGAATRLAESIAHQLRSGPTADRIHLVVVGDAVPSPQPPGTEWVAGLADLGPRGRPDLGDQAELIFCRVISEEDAFPLARYVAGAPHRVVPLVLADLPGAPWSFTVYPSQRPSEVLQPVVF
jgi:hypothetical protein